LAIALALSELLVRTLSPQSKKNFRFEPTVGVTRIPNSTFAFYTFADHKKIIHHTNADGFRTANYPVQKASGVFRIVLLGDSFTEAIQVEDNQSFASLLEQYLNTHSDEKKFEVLNLGYSGYSAAQAYLALKKFGLKYQPDLVIFNILPQAMIARNSQTLENGQSKPFFKVEEDKLVQTVWPQANRLPWIFSFITDHLVLPRFLYDKYQTLTSGLKATSQTTNTSNAGVGRNMVYNIEYPTEWQEAWTITKHLIAAMNQDAKDAGAKFIVVSLPSAIQTVTRFKTEAESAAGNQTLDFQKPDKLLAEFLTQQGIKFLPLYDFFVAAPDNEKFYLKGDWHLSPAGHELVAEKIQNFLNSSGLLPK
jgi:lysophospholipase L1-like esterase